MTASSPLSILFAAERLLPAAGGAERAVLDWLGALAARHAVSACFIPGGARGPGVVCDLPPGVALVRARDSFGPGYWATRRARRDAVGRAVTGALSKRAADVVLTQLHAAPAAIEAAHARGVPAVLVLPSYESLCKYAFDTGSTCDPSSRCRSCPRATALEPSERDELIEARDAHEHTLRVAERLVAPSHAVARACDAWCGRMPDVIRPVAGLRPPARATRSGHVLLAATHWSENKGLGLLVALCSRLRHRRIVLTEQGLPQRVRQQLKALAHVRLVASAPIDDLLAGAGALLVPTQMPESFGRVAFEGLAAGVPTLAAAVGGLTEFVPAGQLVEPPGSVSAWVDAVHRLEQPAAWARARRDGTVAAQALLADSPLEQIEALLRQTAATRGRAHEVSAS